MKEFYKKFRIPDYEIIRNEIINSINVDYSNWTETKSWIQPVNSVLEACPTLKEFLNSRCKFKLQQSKFYYTAPNNVLDPHVDGSVSTKCVPFGMNFPLFNTANTQHIWYDCPPENTQVRMLGSPETAIRDNNGFLHAVDVPKDPSIMPVIKVLELDTPAITKTDIMHSVKNPNDTFRLIVVFRWSVNYCFYNNPNEVINLEDLYYE